MRDILIAFILTTLIFGFKGMRDHRRRQRALRPIWQQTALDVLRQHGGYMSSGRLRRAVEARTQTTISFGTWLELMLDLVERGQVQRWKGYSPETGELVEHGFTTIQPFPLRV